MHWWINLQVKAEDCGILDEINRLAHAAFGLDVAQYITEPEPVGTDEDGNECEDEASTWCMSILYNNPFSAGRLCEEAETLARNLAASICIYVGCDPDTQEEIDALSWSKDRFDTWCEHK